MHIRYVLILWAGFLAAVAPLFADTPANKHVDVVRVESGAVDLDGKLNDPIWKNVRFVDDFLQKDPVEGALPSVRTEIGFAYDDEAFYVGARMWVESADEVSAIVTRRDKSGASDRIIVSLDTYRDSRTAYSFSVTAAGVRTDYYHGSDLEGDRDYSFDPVWEAKTWIGTEVWTAEMRIPFSQLRFNDADQQEWGLNVNRYIPGKNEDIYWIVIPRNGTGWSSRMGAMRGMQGVSPSARIELLPYVAINATIPSEVDPDDPYVDKLNLTDRFGLDAKIGLGPNVTLDLAINPDFGQVEADPAEVNLSVFETSFSERRPFFVEGAGLFSYNGARHFYSRRIGSTPHGFPSTTFDYLDQPQSTTILGAAKLTGRLPSGLSVGGLAAVTEREFARTFEVGTGDERQFEVEPLTFYGVGRVQQEFGANASTVGLIGTMVQREMKPGDPNQNILPRLAITGGTDWTLRFDEGTYQLEGNLATSHVQGETGAIGRLQRSSARYFQRPDADYVSFDSTRTSLTGFAGSLEFEKTTGKWVYTAGASVETPEYELNDIGLLSSTDDIDVWGDLEYRQDKPSRAVRNWQVEANASSSWNFGGVRQKTSYSLEGSVNWSNFLTNYIGVGGNDKGLSDTKTRGGPLMDDVDLLLNVWTGMYNSFGSKTRWSWHVGTGLYEYDGWFLNATAGLGMNVGDRLEVSLDPGYYTEVFPRQFVMKAAGGSTETFGTRYIYSDLIFSQTSMQIHLNYALTPNLTLEFYAEPFVANGRYEGFGELAKAGTAEFEEYNGRINYNEESSQYEVTTSADPVFISNPDFTVRSFRSNFVLRWEWLPGSTFFFVWQQNRSGFEPHGDPVTPALWYDAATDPGDNFLALKFSYWLPVD